MGNPTRNELLAEYYLRAACIAAVWVDATGYVGAEDVPSIEIDPDRTVYCCERSDVHSPWPVRYAEAREAAMLEVWAQG
jgi:hypothetical protein